MITDPKETIDADALASLEFSNNENLEIVSALQFKEKCPNGIDVVIKCGIIGAARLSGMEQFAHALGEEDFLHSAKITREVSDFYGVLSAEIINDDYPCIGVIFGKKCVPEQSSWLQNHFNRIAGNFLRPPSLRHLAQQFAQNVMQDQAVLAVHWRYDSDWFALCRPAAANALSEEHRKLCTSLLCLLQNRQPGLISQTSQPNCGVYNQIGAQEFQKRLLNPLRIFMDLHQLQAIYLVAPPQALSMKPGTTEHFKETMAESIEAIFKETFIDKHVYIRSDLKTYSGQHPGFQNLLIHDTYRTSLSEQEICFKSEWFLGDIVSSWAQTVLADRRSRQIERDQELEDLLTVPDGIVHEMIPIGQEDHMREPPKPDEGWNSVAGAHEHPFIPGFGYEHESHDSQPVQQTVEEPLQQVVQAPVQQAIQPPVQAAVPAPIVQNPVAAAVQAPYAMAQPVEMQQVPVAAAVQAPAPAPVQYQVPVAGAPVGYAQPVPEAGAVPVAAQYQPVQQVQYLG